MEDEVKEFSRSGKKLGEWVDEDMVVKSIKFDPETNVAKVVDKIEKLRVQYVHAPKTLYRCKKGQHFFKMVDASKYIFACQRCSHARKVYPGRYKYDEKTGQLVNRRTGVAV